jgi:hypothetical protein
MRPENLVAGAFASYAEGQKVLTDTRARVARDWNPAARAGMIRERALSAEVDPSSRVAQFICSFAGSNMNVMIADISDDLIHREGRPDRDHPVLADHGDP